MLENNNGPQGRHDERAERLLGEIEDIDRKLVDFLGVKEEGGEKAGGQKGARIIKSRINFVVREVADFLLGDRDVNENLLMIRGSESLVLKVIGRENKWISFYRHKKRNVFGVKIREELPGAGTKSDTMTLKDQSFFELHESKVTVVHFGIQIFNDQESRFINIRTRGVSYFLWDDGLLGSR